MAAGLNDIVKLKIWSDNRGQDLIEYALMAGFVAVAPVRSCRVSPPAFPLYSRASLAR
jgi:hypothetical protein